MGDKIGKIRHYPTTLPHLQHCCIIWTPITALYRGCCVCVGPQDFWHPTVSFVATKGPKLFHMCNINPRIFNCSFSNLHHIFLRPRPRCQSIFGFCSSIFGHQGTKLIFLVGALHPLVFNRSFPNAHQIFIEPRFRPQYIVPTL